MEEDLAQAKRQLSEQDERIRELQMRLQTQAEKAALTRLSDRQELSELVQRAIQDYMRKHPAARTSASSYEAPARAWSAYRPSTHTTSGAGMSPPPARQHSPIRAQNATLGPWAVPGPARCAPRQCFPQVPRCTATGEGAMPACMRSLGGFGLVLWAP